VGPRSGLGAVTNMKIVAPTGNRTPWTLKLREEFEAETALTA